MKKSIAVILSVLLIVFALPAFSTNALVSGDFYYVVEDGTARITELKRSISGELIIPLTLGGYPVTAISAMDSESATSITIHEGITYIEPGTFHVGMTLKTINVAADNPAYCSVDGVLFNKNKTILMRYPAAKQSIIYSVPDGVERIDDYAFKGCANIYNIIIPNSTTYIGQSAFAICSNLKTAVLGNGVKILSEDAFATTSLEKIVIPKSVRTIPQFAFYMSESLSDVWYTGTEENRRYLFIESDNESFKTAQWHYSTCSGEHTYSDDDDAVCDICSWERILFVTGDISVDKNINTSDLAALKIFLSGVGELENTALFGADINSDNTVTTEDLSELKLLLAGE